MAIVTHISNASAIAAVDAIAALLNTGGAGRIDILDGTMPADVDTAITTQTVLASLTLSNPAFAAADDQGGYARAVANSITADTAADAAGTATWFRAYNGAGTAIIDGSVGLADAAMILTDTAIALNDTVTVTTWHLRLNET